MSALDELLSPENFPPGDPLRGDAERELTALRADIATVRANLEAHDAWTPVPHIGDVVGDVLRERDKLRQENERLRAFKALADELADWIRSDSVELFPRADWLTRHSALAAGEERG